MTTTMHIAAAQPEGIDPRIRVFRCGNLVDSFAVITQRYVIVIDTLVNLETMSEAMDLLADDLNANRSLMVVNTHGDWDHTLGNGLFLAPDARYPAPVIAHRLAAERMRSPEASTLLDALQDENPGDLDSASLWPPTVLFEGHLTIDGGDLSVQLFPTPGHQPDHVSVWVPELRLLFAGDAAEMPFPFVANWKTLPELRASLHRLDEQAADKVLYCHAMDITDSALIRHNIAYFDELEQRCRGALAGGTVADDFDGLEDPATTIGWQLEDAIPSLLSVDELPPPEGHATAIKAMLHWVRETKT